jgi:hypothetical protein
MRKILFAVCAILSLFTFAENKNERLLVFHLDFNIIQMRRDLVMELLHTASKAGYNAILWEIENKVMLPSIRSAISPDAFTQEEFREILAEADRLGLEPIPLMQTFGHGEYIMNCPEYRHFRERADKSDCYCVSKRCVREFQLNLLRDYIRLFGSRLKRFHLGGDEAYWFGSCPVCKERDRMELYVEHLESLAGELRSHGIKPGVWDDMLSDKRKKNQVYKTSLPNDYTLWYWDYRIGTEEKYTVEGEQSLKKLLPLKNEIVLCGASQSWGDDPFFANFVVHRKNIDYLGAIARKERYAGFCLTSWSVRQCLKRLQRPLMEYAADRILKPAPDSGADWKRAVENTFGPNCTVEMADELIRGSWQLSCADSRMWSGLKEGIPPPKGWLKDYLATRPQLHKNLPGRSKKEVMRTKDALEKWKKIPSPNEAVKLAIRAAEVKIKFYEMMTLALEGKNYVCPFSETVSFYGEEQSPRSAENSAKLVLGFYIDGL